jgi:hypothetical protein
MPLDLQLRSPLIPAASRPGGRGRGSGLCGSIPAEESPGSKDQRWRLTAAGGDPRESATEKRPPARDYPQRQG